MSQAIEIVKPNRKPPLKWEGDAPSVTELNESNDDRCELEDIHDPKIRRAYIRAHVRAYVEPKLATFERWLSPWAESKGASLYRTRRIVETTLAMVDALLCTRQQYPEFWIELDPEPTSENGFTEARHALHQINGRDISDTLGTTEGMVDIEAEIYSLSGSWPITKDDEETWEIYYSVQRCLVAYGKAIGETGE